MALVVSGLLLLIGLALAAKLSGIGWALSFYDFLRDTSLLMALFALCMEIDPDVCS